MWAPFPGPNAERRQSVGAPLVGALRRAKRREKTIGRGTPCGCPSQGKTPRTGTKTIGTFFAAPCGAGFLSGPNSERQTIGRGAPCGPSFKVVLRCGVRTYNAIGCSPRPSAALRGSKGVKVFSVPLRGPPWIKKGVKVFSAPLRGPPRTKKVLKVFSVPLRGPPWIKGC